MTIPVKGKRRVNAAPVKADAKTVATKGKAGDSKWDLVVLRRSFGLDTEDALDADLSPQKLARAAEQTLFDASAHLSSLITGKKGSERAMEVAAVGRACQLAIQALRKWSDRKLDTERRGSSITSKLIALDSTDAARDILDDMRPHLLDLYQHGEPSDSPFTLPLPLTTLCEELLTLLTTTLIHNLYLRIDHPDYVAALQEGGSFLSWSSLASEATLKRAFTALSKSNHFSARVVALKCILMTSEVDPDAFWGQTCHFASTYAKTIGDSTERQNAVCREISSAYVELVTLASSKDNFVEGENFVKFCKHWISFARRLRDLAMIERVSSYLQASPAHDIALETAQLCARFLRLVTALSKPDRNLTKEINDSILVFAQPGMKKILMDHQVLSESDRLRKACVEFIEKKESVDKEATAAVSQLILALVSSDRLHLSLDSLFVLSRSILDVSDPRSWSVSIGYLEQATAILTSHKGKRKDDSDCSEYQLAYLLRHTANAFYNIGGTLYNADRHAGAARFIKRAAQIFEESLTRYRGCRDDPAAGSSEEWDACERRLPKLWEVLGRCNVKIGDRRDAFDAYIMSLKYAVRLDANTLPLSQEVRLLIERITHLGVSELYLPVEELSLRNALKQQTETPLIGSSVTGAVLETQINFLRYQYKKKDSKVLAKTLMQECIDVYSDEMPIRRARVQIRLLEFACQHNDDTVDVVALAQQIQQLPGLKTLSKDLQSEPLQILYPACAEVWLIFISHRRKQRSDSKAADHGVVEHIGRLTTILQNYKERQAAQLSPQKGKSKTLSKVSRTKTKTKAATPAPAVPPKTPRRTKALPPIPSTKGSQPSSIPGSDLHDEQAKEECDYVFALLEATAHFAGLMGHVLQKVQILDALLFMTRPHLDRHAEAFARASMALALVMQELGMSGAALGIFMAMRKSLEDQNGGISDELEVMLLLRHSQLICQKDADESVKLYIRAFELAQQITTADTTGKCTPPSAAATRIQLLERTALAASVFAEISLVRDDPASCLKIHQQAMRLWGRAADVLVKSNPTATPKTVASVSTNPFDIRDLKEAVAEIAGDSGQGSARKSGLPPSWLSFHRTAVINGHEWRVADGLLTSLFSIMTQYSSRGSVKSARQFVEDAEFFTEALGSPSMYARALTCKAELLLRVGELEEAYTLIMKASETVSTLLAPENVDIHRVHGSHHVLQERDDDADSMYSEGIDVLQNLENKLSAACPDICRSFVSKSTSDREVFLAQILSAILHETVWLWRDKQDDDFRSAFALLVDSSRTEPLKAQLLVLTGKLALHNANAGLHGNLALNSMTESTLSVPLGVSNCDFQITGSIKDIKSLLDQAESSFMGVIDSMYRRGRAEQTRESLVSLALVKCFQASLGCSISSTAVLLSNVLDSACSLTLRREMTDNVDQKLSFLGSADDLKWPNPPSARQVGFRHDDEDDDIDDGVFEFAGIDYKDYWQELRGRYSLQPRSLEELSSSQVDNLPGNWTVVNISSTEDKNAILISRQRPRREPLVLCIPLDRHGRKEDGFGDQQLSFADCITELDSIISDSNEQARQAKSVEGNDGKAAWWTERKVLNARLKELVENIEFCWLGAFKTILAEPRPSNRELLNDMRSLIDRVFSRFIRGGGKPHSMPQLDDVLVECFSTLSPRSRDEELEDLLYFILDLYQSHGVPVALADLDIDEIVVEFRLALDDFACKSQERLKPVEDSHLFLVLDKNVQGIPWESLPVLRGKSVSRIPCLSFLLDRIALPTFDKDRGGVKVDPTRTFYVMNPSADLKHTEDTFRDWAADLEGVGWRGIVGRAPMELEMLTALEREDLFIYFGHGSGEQFARNRKIRNLKRCAATLLWGCSSGLMREQGVYDRIGTPGHYMIAGCPTLVANLWDVTDRDMDKFTKSVFKKLSLDKEHISKWRKAGGQPKDHQGFSVVAAVAQSRQDCKMDFLVGAAPVVYGVPFYL